MRRVVVVNCILSMLLLALIPAIAYADDPRYRVDELSTELHVETNGSIHVTEHHVLTFEGSNRGYIWYLHAPEERESVKIDVVRAAPVDDGGALTGDWTKLQMVDVDRGTQGDWPGDTAAPSARAGRVQPWYSYSISDGMVRSYFPALNATYVLEVDYTITNRIRVYRDIAELYWRYAHASLPVGASDVTLQVVLPVPPDTPVVPGETVRAWGHGPADGAFLVNEDGSVVYHIDRLEAGHYAEAHIVFPQGWISNLADNAPHVYSEMRLQDAVAEESAWVDSYTRGENWDYQVRILFLAIAAAIIAVGAMCLVRFGRTYRARRALDRTACTLAIVGLVAHLFFREPLTVVMLMAAALIVLLLALSMPRADGVPEGEADAREPAHEPESQGSDEFQGTDEFRDTDAHEPELRRDGATADDGNPESDSGGNEPSCDDDPTG